MQTVPKSRPSSPLDHPLREVLVDEVEVVGLELLHIGKSIALAVEVVWVECLDGLQSGVVIIAEKVRVGAFTVPSTKSGLRYPQSREKTGALTGRSYDSESYEELPRGECTGSSKRSTGTRDRC